MNVRRLELGDVALVASIDRSEHVEVEYRVDGGRLVEVPVTVADVPPWDPNGFGEHSVASQAAFCARSSEMVAPCSVPSTTTAS